MDVWFEYALAISELIYSRKLHEYEGVCASLMRKAAMAAEDSETNEARMSSAKEDRKQSGVETTVAFTASWAAPEQPTALMGSSGGRPLTSVDDGGLDVSAPPSGPVASVSCHGTAAGSGNSAASDPCTASSAATSPNTARLTHGCKADQAAMLRPSSLASEHAPAPPGDAEYRGLDGAANSALLSAKAVGALLHAMQLPKSMRMATSRSQQIDEIQAEADVVFQGLEDVFVLQAGDAAAAAVSAEACVEGCATSGASPPLPCPTPTRFERSDEEERSVTSTQSRPLTATPTASVANGGERHLLYGELTSVGVRELQAISIACSCVMRAEHRRSRACNNGPDESDFPNHPSARSASFLGAFSAPAPSPSLSVPCSGSSASLHTGDCCRGHGHTSQGAVIVAVDVGSGNGRLLFEWARLAAAACRCQHILPPRRHAGEGAMFAGAARAPPPLHPTDSASKGALAATRSATDERSRNLISAAYAPLGIASRATTWLGWLGVGIELVPSRMRIAREALAPHYLNLRKTLPAPTAGGGVSSIVTHLRLCLPEANAFTGSSASRSSSASLKAVAARCTTAPPSAAAGAGGRTPQPSARVLLYEGDALAPGVLSNATLCRFPNLDHSDGPVPLRELHAAHGTGSREHSWGVGSTSCPGAARSTTNARTTEASTSKTCHLSTAFAGAYGRLGVQASTSMPSASVKEAGSGCSARERAAEQDYYPLCRVEGGPSLTGQEDPHVVVFCCGLGFDEAQVRQLCQRLEEMLLGRLDTTGATPLLSVRGDPAANQQFSEDVEAAGSVASCTLPPLPSPGKAEEGGVEARLEMQLSTPTPADPTTGSATTRAAGLSSHRHWKSVTCVLLLRPMDVLHPTFPLFRCARRLFDTLHQPILAEDTALLLSTGCRPDGNAVPFSMRAAPTWAPQPGSLTAHDIVDSDVWRTALETTWMSAAPAWVVRFCF
ncbi:hypothetical protein LSCM1_04198 [Leishmania martiniquensis]|uniref:Uncharacterized protein n=1 Tax=Leishmania martiniquensis TaxID=1580590 RepID=A0A836HEV6_9TRYP|nr:hypothetical protein LSCM1_04198 [Leishmania martiniquensis]